MKKLKLDLKGTNLDIEAALNLHQEEICDQIVEAVKYGIETKQDNFVFLEIALTTHTRQVFSKKESWTKALNRCIEYYIETESYEKCAECKALIEKVERMLK